MLNPKIKTPTDFVATLDSSSDAVVSTPILPIPTQIQEAKKTNQSKSSIRLNDYIKEEEEEEEDEKKGKASLFTYFYSMDMRQGKALSNFDANSSTSPKYYLKYVPESSATIAIQPTKYGIHW
ncbi:hypothetical protein GQX74_012166 [Glossina fuscipes]|nr:hypothetical protein GQX74_012166 [Glossina fuscipes]